MNIKRPDSKQPLPEHSKKVFTGQIFSVYQWEQVLFDGSTTTFEKIKRLDTVVVIPILDDGKILLTKQEQPGKEPFIAAAGGQIDLGEDVLAAAKRELLEETGYDAKTFTLWKSLQPISKMEWAIYFFVARGLTKASPLSLDGGEKIEHYPVTFDEFMNIALQPNFYEQEIFRDVALAHIYPEKKEELRQILFGE